MKLARLASHLYPRWWRERYGDEFAALLDDARPGLAGAFDIAKGALTMQLTTWSPGRTMAASLVLGLAVSGAILVAMPREFTSVAVIAPTTDIPAAEMTKQVNLAANTVLGRTWVQSVISDLKLYTEETNREDAAQRFRRDIKFSPTQTSTPEGPIYSVAVSFEHSDALTAQRVAGVVTSRILDTLPPRQFDLHDPPSLPHSPTFPSTLGIMSMGLAASVAIGGALALLVRRKRAKKAA